MLPVCPEQIAKLIAKLGDDDYSLRHSVRAGTTREASASRPSTFCRPPKTATTSKSRARARYLVRSMQVNWVADSDPPEVKPPLEEYATARSLRYAPS